MVLLYFIFIIVAFFDNFWFDILYDMWIKCFLTSVIIDRKFHPNSLSKLVATIYCPFKLTFGILNDNSIPFFQIRKLSRHSDQPLSNKHEFQYKLEVLRLVLSHPSDFGVLLARLLRSHSLRCVCGQAGIQLFCIHHHC